MATSLIFQITDAGVQAANAANNGGPQVNLTTFQVGTAYGYIPSSGDKALHGTALYSGPFTDYQEDGVDAVLYTMVMDQTVGTFNFGEIGIFTDTGVLFALAAFAQPQEKVQATTTNPGNFVSLEAKLVLTNIAPVINFTQTVSTNAKLLEIPAPDGLSSPALVANPNVYSIQGGDEIGNPIVAVRDTTTGLWSFSTHPVPTFTGTIDGASTVTLASCSNIVAANFNYTANRYIIQFTAGQNKGLARYVSGVLNGSLSFTALTAVPATGDQFAVYESTAFRALQNTYATDSGAVNSYVLSTTPALNAVSEGMVLSFVAKASNTGASTATIANVQYPLMGLGGALQGGEILSGYRQTIMFSGGTCYLLSSGSGALSVGSATQSRHAVQLGQLQNALLNVFFNGITGATLTTSGAAVVNGLLTATAGLTLQSGTGTTLLGPDSNTNNLRVRVGGLGAYKYAVLDTSANLTLGGGLNATGNVSGANATQGTHAVMLGQLQDGSLTTVFQNATVGGTLTAQALNVSSVVNVVGAVTAANATQDSQAAMLGQVKALIQALLPIGHLLASASTNVPPNYLPCDGAAYSRTAYAGLFAQIGTLWGAGDGSTTFNVPDFRRRVMIGSGGIQVSPQAPGTAVGSYGGEETHVLTSGEMPNHTHQINDPTHVHSLTDLGHYHVVVPGGWCQAGQDNGGASTASGPNQYGTYNSQNGGMSRTTSSQTGISMGAAQTGITMQPAGNSASHNNVQPSATVAMYIKYQ